jgi:hypothetical protein
VGLFTDYASIKFQSKQSMFSQAEIYKSSLRMYLYNFVFGKLTVVLSESTQACIFVSAIIEHFSLQAMPKLILTANLQWSISVFVWQLEKLRLRLLRPQVGEPESYPIYPKDHAYHDHILLPFLNILSNLEFVLFLHMASPIPSVYH